MAKKNHQGEGGGVPNRGSLYNKTAKHFDEILEKLLDLMRNSKQESVQASAANKLIDKILPNLKSAEITGPDGQPFTITWKVTGNPVHPDATPVEAPQQQE